MAVRKSSIYRKNATGMRALVNSAEVGGAMAQAAERGKEFAENISPRRTGKYASSFEVVETKVTVGGETRAGAQLSNTDPKAPFVEWGHGGKHVLQRAVDEIEKG